MEKWKWISGYYQLYEISNTGKVRRKERVLKSKTLSSGYEKVNLWKNGKQKSFRIHRLVAIHFIKNPKNLYTVNHKDGDRFNNTQSNLEWCTLQENLAHAKRTGLHKNSHFALEKCRKSKRKLTNDQVLQIKKMKTYGLRVCEISKKLDIQYDRVAGVYNNKSYLDIGK